MNTLNPVASALEAQIEQLKFLLAVSPMMNAPEGDFDMRRIQVPFVYINPKTLTELQARCGQLSGSVRGATQWIPLSGMPEGRVIYAYSQPPWLEKPSVI